MMRLVETYSMGKSGTVSSGRLGWPCECPMAVILSMTLRPGLGRKRVRWGRNTVHRWPRWANAVKCNSYSIYPCLQEPCLPLAVRIKKAAIRSAGRYREPVLDRIKPELACPLTTFCPLRVRKGLRMCRRPDASDTGDEPARVFSLVGMLPADRGGGPEFAFRRGLEANLCRHRVSSFIFWGMFSFNQGYSFVF